MHRDEIKKKNTQVEHKKKIIEKHRGKYSWIKEKKDT